MHFLLLASSVANGFDFSTLDVPGYLNNLKNNNEINPSPSLVNQYSLGALDISGYYGINTINHISPNLADWQEEDYAILYLAYLKKYNKDKNDAVGSSERFTRFKSSINSIIEHNSQSSAITGGPYPFTLGIGPFLDEDLPTGGIDSDDNIIYEDPEIVSSRSSRSSSTGIDLPAKYPGCFEVYNQGGCGSCYAFAGIGLAQSMACMQHYEKFNEPWLADLSHQGFMDCVDVFLPNTSLQGNQYWGYGCDGGRVDMLGWYANDRNFKGKICSGGPNQRYSGKEGSICNVDCHKEDGLSVTRTAKKFTSIAAVKDYLTNVGPIISIVYMNSALQSVTSGVFTDPNGYCNGQAVNHAILIVGFGEENGIPYWKVQNSYGKMANDHGFFKIKIVDNGMSLDDKKNTGLCGIQGSMSYNDVQLVAPYGSLVTSTTTTTYWEGKPIQDGCIDNSTSCAKYMNAASATQCTTGFVERVPDFNYLSALCPASCASKVPSISCEEFQCMDRDCSKDYYGNY